MSSSDDDHYSQDEDDDESQKSTTIDPLSNVIPKFSKAMLIPCTIITPSLRMTHSDVMCTTTTTRQYHDSSTTTARTKNTKCRLPYNEACVSTRYNHRGKKTPLNNHELTSFEAQQAEAARARKSKELHSEHRTFMERLKMVREGRIVVETNAALLIQKCFRGYTVRIRERSRLFPERYRSQSSRRKPMEYTVSEIRHELSELAKLLDVSFSI